MTQETAEDSARDAADQRIACPNCATVFAGNYCPHCAQPAKIAIPTVGKFLGELADKILAVQGKLPLTVRTLCLRPGALTADYLDGRRERYLKPLNLYVAVSLLFFLFLSLVPGVSLKIGIVLEVTTLAMPQSSIEGHTGIAAVDRGLAAFAALPPQSQHHILRDGMIRNAPRVMLVLVPLFAGLLALLVRRRYYGEHLLFALHFHSFAFLLLMPGLVPWPQPLHDGVNNAINGVLGVYLFIALRRVYGGSIVLSLIRVVGVAGVYVMAIAAAALLGLAAGIA